MKNFGLENLTDKEIAGGSFYAWKFSGCKDRNEIISIIKEKQTRCDLCKQF